MREFQASHADSRVAALAQVRDAAIGGGKRVRLTEPNGYTIEVVHGVETVDEIPLDRFAYNLGNIDKSSIDASIVST